jgi:NAD(P)H-flavin reductase
MRQTQAIIQRIRRVNAQYQHVELGIDESLSDINPGQSLLVRQDDSWQPYLRERWWPVQISPQKVVVERPNNVRYEPGDIVNVLGPVGSFFRFRRSLRHVLLLAYDTPPTPMLSMIPLLTANQTGITLALLGTASAYKTEHLPPEVEVVHGTADLEWENRVMTVGLADQVFATVHPDDEIMRFSKIWHMFSELRANIPKNYLFGVFQPVQPCGIAACYACMIQMKQGTALACTDGPTIDLSMVRL